MSLFSVEEVPSEGFDEPSGDSSTTSRIFDGSGGGPLGNSIDDVEVSGPIVLLLSVEIIEDVFPLRIFVSTNAEPSRSDVALPFVATEALSMSCRIFPAVSDLSPTADTCPSAACMSSSTAGLAQAEGGGLLAFRLDKEPKAVNTDEGRPAAPSNGALFRSTSRILRSDEGSRGCSLRVMIAEHDSGSCHTVSSLSGLGFDGEEKNLNDEEVAVEAAGEEGMTAAGDDGAAGLATPRGRDNFASSCW